MTSGKAQDEYEYQLRQQNLDKVRSLRDQLEAAEQRTAEALKHLIDAQPHLASAKEHAGIFGAAAFECADDHIQIAIKTLTKENGNGNGND